MKHQELEITAEEEWWPVSEHGRCPTCGRFTSNRVAHRSGDERGWITAKCAKCGDVELQVVGWMNSQGRFA